MDFQAKAREVLLELLGTFSDATDRDSLCFIADALRAAALDEGAREAARAEMGRLLAGVRARAETPAYSFTWNEPAAPLFSGEDQLVADMTQPAGALLPNLPPGMGWTRTHTSALESVLERLLWLLGLSEGERRFVKALADDAGDFVTLQVFADWLEDEGRTKDGACLRRLVPQDGDVILWRVPRMEDPDVDPVEAARPLAQHLCGRLSSRGIETLWVVLPIDSDLKTMPAEVMRAAGWVRAADVRRARRDVADDAVTMPGGVDAAVQTALDLFPAPEAPP